MSPHTPVSPTSGSTTILPRYTRQASVPLPSYANGNVQIELERVEQAHIVQKYAKPHRTSSQDLEVQDTISITTTESDDTSFRAQPEDLDQEQSIPWPGHEKPTIALRIARIASIVLFLSHIIFFTCTWELYMLARRDRAWFDSLPSYWRSWIEIARATRWYAMGGWFTSCVTSIVLHYTNEKLWMERTKTGKFSGRAEFMQQIVLWEWLVLFVLLTWQFLHF